MGVLGAKRPLGGEEQPRKKRRGVAGHSTLVQPGREQEPGQEQPPEDTGAEQAEEALRNLRELRRHQEVKRLRALFRQRCVAAGLPKPPLLGFERWLGRAQLSAPSRAPAADPLLPMGGWTDPSLTRDLVRAGATQADAESVMASLIAASAAAAREVAALQPGADASAGASATVCAERRRQAMHYSLVRGAKPFFKLTHAHHRKLMRLWRRTRQLPPEASLGEREQARFDAAVLATQRFLGFGREQSFTSCLVDNLLIYWRWGHRSTGYSCGMMPSAGPGFRRPWGRTGSTSSQRGSGWVPSASPRRSTAASTGEHDRLRNDGSRWTAFSHRWFPRCVSATAPRSRIQTPPSAPSGPFGASSLAAAASVSLMPLSPH